MAICRGSTLVVQPTGGLTWAVRGTDTTAGLASFTLGRYPVLDLKAAGGLGAKALRAVAEGRDPGRAEDATCRRRPRTIASSTRSSSSSPGIARRLRPGPAHEVRARILREHVLPAWRGFVVSEITRADVRALVEPMESTPVQANRSLQNRAADDLRGRSRTRSAAAVGRPMRRHEGAASRRDLPAIASFPSDPELSLIWQAANTLGGPGGLLILLLLFAGQRRGEVAGLTWSELDLEQGIWTLPAARVKNNKAHLVPLAAAVVEILRGTPRLGPYVVSMSSERPTNDFAQIKRAIDALLPADTPRWTFHDLRRSFASGLARLGTDLPVIERALNHVSGSFRGVMGGLSAV